MYAIVVDPFSSGFEYLEELRKQEIKIIVIISKNAKRSSLYFEIKNSDVTIFDESIDLYIFEKIKKIVGKEKILFSLPGAETGVELSDHICHIFSLKANDYNLSRARINKFEMQERLKICGLKSIKQKLLCTHNFDCSNFLFPVVLKPTESAASDGVTFCKNKEEFIKSFNLFFGKMNKLGKINKELVLQEFVSGTEYVVDIVANDQYKEIIAMWEYEKILNENGRFIYFSLKMITSVHKNYKNLLSYSLNIADALGINYGPAHMEIMMNQQDEPVLIEVGSRPHGGKSQIIMKDCFGFNQITRTIELALGFEKLKTYEPKKYGELVFLISNKEGKFSNFGKIKEIENLPGYQKFFPFLNKDDNLEKTQDLLNIPGIVLFSHKNSDLVRQGVIKLREIEKENDFYITQ